MTDCRAVVELTITDKEPFRSFTAAVGSTLALLATVAPEDLPEPARLAAAGLRSACELLGVTVPQREEPGSYRGVIIIEWPAPRSPGPYSAMAGCLLNISDAVTGKPIRTAVDVTIHAGAEHLVTADLTLLADSDGEPIYDGEPVPDGGGWRTGVFTFLVGEMRVAER